MLISTIHPLLSKPLYINHFPDEICRSLVLDDLTQPVVDTETSTTGIDQVTSEFDKALSSCRSCPSVQFLSVDDQRAHYKSDLHRFNLKRKNSGLESLNEQAFEDLLEGLANSLSGSESEVSDASDNDTTLNLLLQKHTTSKKKESFDDRVRPAKSPFLWLRLPEISDSIRVGIFKALFTATTTQGLIAEIRTKPQETIAMFAIGGGHFAGMIISLAPKIGSSDPNILVQKSFHRYTTRRKQGGSQAANDSAKGKAHSAGSNLRRAQELELKKEVRELLSSWEIMIRKTQLIFVRASGKLNKSILFNYERAVLHGDDTRLRTFPFTTRRATASELKRCYNELTRVIVVDVNELQPQPATETNARKNKDKDPKPQPISQKASPEEEERKVHTTTISGYIRRSKISSLVAYLKEQHLPIDFLLFPESTHAHSPRPLHLASALSQPLVVSVLLERGADPTSQNEFGRTPFELAGDKATREAFRISRHELGEDRWAWDDAKVPSGLTLADVEARRRRSRERREKEILLTQQKTERSEEISEQSSGIKYGVGRLSAVRDIRKTEREEREMTPEARIKLQRERFARAAEARAKAAGSR
ncbi:VMS1 protein [Neolecta irregularis DAH-3]|uniref:VMS1 protein n=1 Tax=Neolecta irregularis (strain DAH-3) TaxID=1198029 RepID=A0A1U7LGF6_NEOID|nr:VMS1 protein [Neolecta irregularis DAH-3]|eukprot:OLL21740.1 VMS1 protein [Neolecta irregularis DAH-3]